MELVEKLNEEQMPISDFSHLFQYFDAIHLWYADPEAARGGATEPHVSYVLSARLSSRPMAWSKEKLTRFLPILADGRPVI